MRILKRLGHMSLIIAAFSGIAFSPAFGGPSVMDSNGTNPLQPIHYWNFNDTNHLLTASFTVGGGTLNIDTGTAAVVLFATGQEFIGENARFGDPVGAHLRLNNPIGATNTLALPTTGFEDIVLAYETRRSGLGAGLQVLEYSTNGVHFAPLPDIVTYNAAPTLHIMDLAGIEGVDNNSDFTVRITFQQGTGWTEGNNRFDNITVDGRALDNPTQPPEVTEAIAIQELIENGAFRQINLNDVYTDPDGDPMTFAASSHNTGIATVHVIGETLTVTPVSRGQTLISVSANDGYYPLVHTHFLVLVYPKAHALDTGGYGFDEWASDEPAGSYPEHMIFLQSDQSDTGLITPLLHAYHIPEDDAARPEDGLFPYNAEFRTRITGMGEEGISFINTGRERDLGGALLALDTRNVTNATIGWLAGTVTTNVRVYAIRLQYRIGIDGPFTNVVDDAEQPIEYKRNEMAGHIQAMPPVSLPEEALEEEYVQVLWRYYLVEGDLGARAELRLDDIVVLGDTVQPAVALEFMDPPPAHWQSGRPLPTFTVRAVNEDGFTDVFFDGIISLAITEGPGSFAGQTNSTAVNGVALFTGTVINGAGAYTLQAESGLLTPDTFATLYIHDEAVFVPGDEGDWTDDANWTSLTYPNAVSAEARINAPTIADRDVVLRAPVTLGRLIVSHTNTASRNRVRDRGTFNTFTFATADGPAQLEIVGSGTGLVEIEVDAGTILATNLVIAVDHMEGDPEYGALRLRSVWTGVGGIRKTGYGVMSMTGGNKVYDGETVIEAGVLRVTQPAAPYNGSGVTVLPGGQLRLVSASTLEEPVRVYTFGGIISLNSQGRGGPVPVGEEQGVLGALRYDPGWNDNVIKVTSDIQLAGPSSLHVDGTRNLMELSGALSGADTISKTGGGVLSLSGDSAGYTAPITLTTGEIRVDGTVGSPITVTSDTTVRGSGAVGALSGQGRVAPGPGYAILTANFINGLNYAFCFSQMGAPTYAQPNDSGNDLLRLTNATPVIGGFNAGNIIHLYFDVTEIHCGNSFLGGFFTDSEANFLPSIQGGKWFVYLEDEDGVEEHDGKQYTEYIGPLSAVYDAIPQTADFVGGHVDGRILRIQFLDTEETDGIPNWWWNRHPAITEPDRIANADFDDDGYTNLEEYIADTDPTDSASFPEPGITTAEGTDMLTLTTGATTNSRVYDVWWNENLAEDPQAWTRMNLNVPGAPHGGPVNLMVTNDAPIRAYRTGVSLP